jgi:hypothetical protein
LVCGRRRHGTQQIDFNRDIRPILTSHCTACHGGVKEAGGISFVFREKALAAGESGNPTIIPGDPDGSELIKRVTPKTPTWSCPSPSTARRCPRRCRKLRQWIQEGAKWQEHWAFVQPVAKPPPAVKNRLAEKPHRPLRPRPPRAENLQPNPEAEPALLLRRLSIDLTGLPPTLAELDAFEAAWNPIPKPPGSAKSTACSPPALRRTLGRNLARPRPLRRHRRPRKRPPRICLAFRDWVDPRLQRRPALRPVHHQTTRRRPPARSPPSTTSSPPTSTATQNNGEGGTDDEEFRVAAVMDRVATTWEAWQASPWAACNATPTPTTRSSTTNTISSYAFFNNARDYDLSQHFPLLPVPKDPARSGDFTAW